MKFRFLSFILVLALIFSSAMQSEHVSAADAETITFPVRYVQSDARQMADKVNQYRRNNGLAELAYDANLERVAMQRAAEIVVRFNDEGENHFRPDGYLYEQTFRDFGFNISDRGILCAENILVGTDDKMGLNEAFDQFCQENKNREIMLSESVMFGVSHIHMDDKTDFWVQVYVTEGTPASVTAPFDGVTTVSVKVNPALVEDVTVEYESGDHTVATGSIVSVPRYIPKITVTGCELKDPLTLSPLVFESNDGYVRASGGTMTGLKVGSGNITATLFGRTFTYGINVTYGSDIIPDPTNVVTSQPTQTVTSTPTPADDEVVIIVTKPTQTVTSTPSPTQAITTVPSPTQTVVTQAPTQTVTSTPQPTQTVTSAPSPTQTVTAAPSPTQSVVTQAPTQTVTTTPNPTQAVTSTPTPTQGASQGLKVGDTFTEGKLRYKITSTTTVSVIALASGNATSITIPASVKHEGINFSVTKIASSAFENKTKLKTVKIGKNVKNIETKAFKGCTSLTKITIPKKATKIGKSAFYGCSKLKTITFSGTAKSIGKNAFTNISSKAVIKVPSASYKKVKSLLEKSGATCSIKKS